MYVDLAGSLVEDTSIINGEAIDKGWISECLSTSLNTSQLSKNGYKRLTEFIYTKTDMYASAIYQGNDNFV